MICVYLHINPVKQEIFYVGIGTEARSIDTRHRNRHWHHVVNKYGYTVVIIERGLTREQAIEREKYYIKLFGRNDLDLGTLVNMTDGGDGSVNVIFTEEARAKIRAARAKQIIKPHTEENKRRWSLLRRGDLRGSRVRYNLPILLDIVTGIYYESFTEAGRAYGVVGETIKRWMKTHPHHNKSNLILT